MALDEPLDTDNKFTFDGFEFLVDEKFLKKVQPIKVDFLTNGFKLDCGVTFSSGPGCSSCGTDESSCHT